MPLFSYHIKAAYPTKGYAAKNNYRPYREDYIMNTPTVSLTMNSSSMMMNAVPFIS